MKEQSAIKTFFLYMMILPLLLEQWTIQVLKPWTMACSDTTSFFCLTEVSLID